VRRSAGSAGCTSLAMVSVVSTLISSRSTWAAAAVGTSPTMVPAVLPGPRQRGQKGKHAVRLQKMTRYRLRIQQLTLIIRSTLHTKIIVDDPGRRADRHTD
jgi:hypothetical protein